MPKNIQVNSISPSTVRQFTEGCPEAVFLDKIDKVPRKGTSAAALLGSSFHSVAESFYRALMLGKSLDATTLYRVFEARWNIVNPGDIIYGKGDKQALHEKAKELIELLVLNGRPEGSILAVEVGLNYPLTDDLSLIGTPDVVYRDKEGHLCIADIKTSATKYSEDQIYQATCQTFAYAKAYNEPVKIKLFLFIKTKAPRFEIIDLDLNDIDHDEWKNRYVQTKRALELGLRYKVRSWACKTCSFSYRCNEKKQAQQIPLITRKAA